MNPEFNYRHNCLQCDGPIPIPGEQTVENVALDSDENYAFLCEGCLEVISISLYHNRWALEREERRTRERTGEAYRF